MKRPSIELCTLAVFALVAAMSLGCRPATDEGAPSPAASGLSGLAVMVRGCVSSSWTTYGHDPNRTSVAKAFCPGALEPVWSFTPEGVNGRPAVADHVVVVDAGVFVAALLGESTAAYRLDPATGKATWTFDSRTDIHHGRWPTTALGYVVLNDDGLFVLDPRTGKKRFDRGVDWWGQTLTDDEFLYLVNTWHIHGPRVFVAAFDNKMEPVWKANEFGQAPEDYKDTVGAIALDRGRLFQALRLQFGGPTGLYAFNAMTGDELWNVPATPASAISAASGQVYGVELVEHREVLRLVARSQVSGDEVWSEPVDATDRQAPAVFGGRILTYTRSVGVTAWGASSGGVGWEHPADAFQGNDGVRHATHIAIAALSSTIIVASGATLSTLDARDGSLIWKGPAPGSAANGVHSPVVANGHVYVVRGGSVYALRCAISEKD